MAFLEDTSNALRCFGKRWHHFGGQDQMLDPATPVQKPVFIVMASDQEGKQPGALNDLKSRGIWAEHIPGMMHRRSNDTWLGFKESGHYQRCCFNCGDL